MSGYTNDLILKLEDSGELSVYQPCQFFVFSPISNIYVDLPFGFTTDLTSVDWMFQWAVPKLGRYNKESVVHDKLYRHPFLHSVRPDGSVEEIQISRFYCDLIFYEAMLANHVKRYRAMAMFTALRVGGWYRWDQLREKDQSGADAGGSVRN